MKVTKEDLERAEASAHALANAANAADDARAAARAIANEAWDKYIELKQEYEDGIKSTED